MIAQLARFANDCYHVVKAPTGSKTAILRDLILPGNTRMGFGITFFDRATLNHLYREIFVKLDVEGAEHRVLCDLVQTGKIVAILHMVVEYHHRIGAQKSCLGEFLSMLERAGFEYQIHAAVHPINSQPVFQDMLIGAYR
jgi:hypothetical protein